MVRFFVSQEYQYLSLLKRILKTGVKEVGRNGTTYSQIGGMMRFSLEDNKIPLMTTKKLAWKSCLKELLWFIKGDTNNKLLQKQNVKIKELPPIWNMFSMHKREMFNHNWQDGEDKTPFFIKYSWLWHFTGFPIEDRTNIMKQTWEMVGDRY